MSNFTIQPKSVKHTTNKSTMLPTLMFWPNLNEQSKKDGLSKILNPQSFRESQIDGSETEKLLELNPKLDRKAGSTSMQQYRATKTKMGSTKFNGNLASSPESFIGSIGVLSPGAARKEENIKKIMLCEKIGQLKHSLNKYQDTEEQGFLPTRMDVKKIIKCLEILHDTESSLSELMKIVIKVLKHGLFVNSRLLEPFEGKLREECDGNMDQLLENCKREEVPYYLLCISLLKELTSETRKEKRMEFHYQEVDRLEAIIKQNKDFVNDLQRDLEDRVVQEEYQRVLKEVAHYKQISDDLTADNKVAKGAIQELSEECTSLRKLFEQETNENDKLNIQIRELERARDTVIKETEESRNQVHAMKVKIKGFKDVMDKLIVKLGNVKQQVFDLREENGELKYQNEKLSLRAARGFDALTPRPDYRKLQEEKKLDFDVFDATGRRQIKPTMKIMEDLWNNRKVETVEKARDGSAKRRDTKGLIPKITAASAFKMAAQQRPSLRVNSSNNPRPSIFGENNNILPQLQKQPSNNASFVAGDSSPNNDTFTGQDMVLKLSKEASKTLDSDNSVLDIADDGDQSFISKFGISPKKGDEPFGEETIRQANELIDFAVKSKKAIDNFE